MDFIWVLWIDREKQVCDQGLVLEQPLATETGQKVTRLEKPFSKDRPYFPSLEDTALCA